MAKDPDLKPFNYPLNGRLITKLDGTLLPDAHFQVLDNMRYNDGGIEPVVGMTKINASALAKLKVQNGFHFKKTYPSEENHVFVQVTNTADSTSAIYKSDNSTSIPAQDTFTLFKALDSDNTVYFSDAPDQSMVFCDGYHNYVYSGSEYRCASFINFAPDDSFSYDFTKQANNNLTDTANVYALTSVAAGIDASTKALWHFNSALTDSSGNSHTLTGVGTPTYSTGLYGNAITLNGTTQYVYIAPHADFDMTGGTWTLDGKFRVHSTSAVNPILFWKQDVKKFSYDTGTHEPTVGQTLYGETSGAVIVVLHVDNSGGWAGAGTGDIWYRITSGNIANGEHVHEAAGGTGQLVCNTTSAETDGGDNYIQLSVTATGAIEFIIYEAYSTSNIVSLTSPAGVVTANAWNHIEIVESGNSWYMFGGLSSGTSTLYASSTNSSRAEYYYGNIQFGYNNTVYYDGDIEEVRFSDAARHTDVFTIPVAAYDASASTHIYIGSTRPISGVKCYINTANATAATITGYYWNGTGWVTVGTITDGTEDPAGTPLAVTGTISFSSTATIAKAQVINENFAYYYYFIFSGIDDTTELYQTTLVTPVQDIVDIWDGIPRQIYSCLLYKTSYADYTTNVYTLDYDSTDATTYMDLAAMESTHYLYFGFNERLTGMKVYLGETTVNANASIASVDYWNGSAWTSVGAIVDGTSVSGASFARTGTISWNAITSGSEFPLSVGNSSKWYYYRLHFSATLSTHVNVDYVSGIPVQASISPYRYPVLWQNRLWLLNDQSSNKNAALGSSYGTVCVFNGTDSGTLIFGGMKDVQCGKTLFTRYGGSLYENLIVCKNSETFLVDGTSFSGDSNGSGAFIVYQVSGTRGCIAPLTMQSCDTGYEVAPGVTKHILAWLSSSGVIMFDSNSMIEVSNDIGDRFFQGNTYSILTTMANQSAGFYDSTRGEYHLLIPAGSTATYLNEEWVYDVIRKKWFQIKRSTKYLWSGFSVEDAYGNQYVYGGTADGYLERLEYGATFDGVSIAYKFRLPDSLMNNSWDTRKEMRQIRLVGICKTTTTETITVNHYADGATTASTPATTAIANKKTGRRFYKFMRSVSFRGTTHSLEFTITTDDESGGGFHPLFVGGLFKVIDYDTEDA